MSTHALVGVKTLEGFKARFVHFDGYPSAMIPALERAMQDENPIAYILGNHWVAFNKSQHEAAEADSHGQTWYTETSNIDHAYLYLIDPDRKKIESFINLDSKWIEVNPNNVIMNKRRD